MSVSLALLNELMGIVPNASDHGPTIDHMLEFCHWFMLVLFVGWSAFFLYTIFRFHHSRHPRANYHGVKGKASAHLEFLVVVIEAVLLLGFAIPLWGKRVTEFPDKEKALRVRAIGEQFAWYFLYPGPDGKFGRQDASFVTPANPLGLDPNDPDGKDDFFSKADMQLVSYRPTMIEITSKDVIHSLSLHAMRMDQDAIPGLRVPMWFRPTKSGNYEIVCAQLCGAGHYSMKGNMTVGTQAEFDQWAMGIIKQQHPDYQAPAAPAGTTTAPASTAAPAPAAK
jgi:cytochrome c oxidase subunit 2